MVGYIYLSNVINLVRRRLQQNGNNNNNNGDNVEEATSATLAMLSEMDATARDTLFLDRALVSGGEGDDVEDRILSTTLRSTPTLRNLTVVMSLGATSIQELLLKTMPSMTKVKDVLFVGNAENLTAFEAEGIFSMLQTCNAEKVGYDVDFLVSASEGVGLALAKCIQELSSLVCVFLYPRARNANIRNANMDDRELSISAKWSHICEALGRSNSLRAFAIYEPLPMVSDVVQKDAAKQLASAIANSSSIEHVRFYMRPSHPFCKQVHDSLLETPAAKTLDLCFWIYGQNGKTHLWLMRENLWRRLLSRDDEIPLEHWPNILEAASDWNYLTSHSPLDALFFLMREKNDVILQNVQSTHEAANHEALVHRRNRKRKRSDSE